MALEREADLIETMMEDARIRKAIAVGHGLSIEPMSVWLDSDQSALHTQLGPNMYPKWEECTEYLKMFIAFDAGMEQRTSYSFTSHISPRLLRSWPNGTLMDNVEQRLRRAVRGQGLRTPAYCYVAEARTKWGKARTKPHIHGFFVANDALEATKFKVALEEALDPELLRVGRKRPVDLKLSYDWREEFLGRPRWIDYFTKNVGRWDAGLGKRRVFMSTELTGLAREAWAYRREKPL